MARAHLVFDDIEGKPESGGAEVGVQSIMDAHE
jgi:hypothetical protein